LLVQRAKHWAATLEIMFNIVGLTLPCEAYNYKLGRKTSMVSISVFVLKIISVTVRPTVILNGNQ